MAIIEKAMGLILSAFPARLSIASPPACVIGSGVRSFWPRADIFTDGPKVAQVNNTADATALGCTGERTSRPPLPTVFLRAEKHMHRGAKKSSVFRESNDVRTKARHS